MTPKVSPSRVHGIYAIIDPQATRGDPLDLTAAVLAGGIKVLQLRAKKLPAGDMLALAQAMKKKCATAGALFVVNDRLDVALAVKADGVHLGQDDLPLLAARKIAPNLLIGISTHSLAEALAAEKGGADYIGFGAMYATPSKNDVTLPQGPEKLREVVTGVSLPVIAIGGITAEKIPELRATGAKGAAVISALASAADPLASAKELVRLWQDATR